VLTGGSERIETGLSLLDEGLADRLFVSGVGEQVKTGDLLPRTPSLRGDVREKVTVGTAANNTPGNALFEAYDLDNSAGSRFANISTRGFVQTDDNVMIAGLMVQGFGSKDVLIRALGPTLGQPPFNVLNSLSNPFLDLRDANGMRMAANDNWKSDQQAQIRDSGLAPSHDAESALAVTLAPGGYTAIVSGVNNTTGNALVEVYGLN